MNGDNGDNQKPDQPGGFAPQNTALPIDQSVSLHEPVRPYYAPVGSLPSPVATAPSPSPAPTPPAPAVAASPAPAVTPAGLQPQYRPAQPQPFSQPSRPANPQPPVQPAYQPQQFSEQPVSLQQPIVAAEVASQLQPDASTQQPVQNLGSFGTTDPNALVESVPDQPFVPELAWTAPEFVAKPKPLKWYLILVTISAVIIIGFYLIFKDFVTLAVLTACAGLFAYTASRSPRNMQYALDHNSVLIGSRSHQYAEFRSFSIVHDTGLNSIDFMPLKRFSPPLTISYLPEHEDHILELLTQHLPLVTHKRTWLDGLMHRIGF